MMKFIFCCLISLAAGISSYAQTPSAIQLAGTASAKVNPDEILMDFTVTGHDKSESVAMNNLSSNVNALTNLLNKQGNNQLHIQGFSVTPDITYENGAQKNNGFVATQQLQMKMDMDRNKIASLMQALQNGNLQNTQMQFGAMLSDELEKSTRSDLLRKAIDDAKDKATILADEAGLKISSVASIQYNVPRTGSEPMMSYAPRVAEANSSWTNLDVQPIDLNETVIVGYIAQPK
jgi:uncharacterized protein YggE